MAFKVLAIFALIFVAASATYQETSCTSQGGYCMMKTDCPNPLKSGFDMLCPQQFSSGVVCCNDPMPAKCLGGAGECTANCPSKIRHFSNECRDGQHCCVWL